MPAYGDAPALQLLCACAFLHMQSLTAACVPIATDQKTMSVPFAESSQRTLSFKIHLCSIARSVCECSSALTRLFWLSQASGASLATGPIGTACPQPGGVPPSARWEDPDPDQALKAAIQRQKAEEAVTMFAIKVSESAACLVAHCCLLYALCHGLAHIWKRSHEHL